MMYQCVLVAASLLVDSVLTGFILVCGVRALASCSVSAVLESGHLLMLSLWQQATLALQMDHCTLFEFINFSEQLHSVVVVR